MEKDFKFELTNETVENLQAYSTLLNKDINAILEEALSQYFENEQEKLLSARALETDNGMTNLDYDEFWDNVDI